MTDQTFRCGDCGWTGPRSDTGDAEEHRIAETLAYMDTGDVYSVDTCPECDALAFPVEPVKDAAHDLRDALAMIARRIDRASGSPKFTSDDHDALLTLLARAGGKPVDRPSLSEALRQCRGAMNAMRTQIDQMAGMFPDSDGAIAAACQDHDDADATATEALA